MGKSAVTVFLSIALLFGIVPVYAQTGSADQIIGTWRIESGLDVRIYRQDDRYYGEIVALNGYNGGQTVDDNNPKEKFHTRSLIGMVIIENLKYDAKDHVWTGGKMYAPHLGITANLEILEVNGNTITAEGSKFFFWHEEEWKKVK